MGLLTWIILGAIAGAIATWIMPGDDPGGFIASAMGLGEMDEFSLGTVVIAILGAILLLFLYRAITGKRARPRT